MLNDFHDDFLALSRILTGIENLDEKLGLQYLDRLASTPYEPFLRRILERFQGLRDDATIGDGVKQQIVGDDTLRPTVCQIILLWYTSAVRDNLSTSLALGYGTPDEYFSGLAWLIIGAHVPGLSGGHFGYWRYRPDNELKETV